ncbi:hypothetical protein BDV96DRAFT_676860 [Lophiotrema nucula]|uniref:F-box domain-containing protein n=1 Tax=Lophiotrema nucula TaxID=690887 RepID=A0A6A5YEU4_9PLEO|nr:hypothetical protein BDV96DRAFT_676860 [Lophiotrema nucula]
MSSSSNTIPCTKEDTMGLPVRPRLNGLATEVIQRIGIYCTSHSLFALGKTCKVLRRNCYDTAVFREAVRFRLAEEMPAAPFEESHTMRRDQSAILSLNIRLEKDAQLWAHYVVALSRVRELEEGSLALSAPQQPPPSEVFLLSDKMLRYMPHLLILGCTSLCRLQIATYLITLIHEQGQRGLENAKKFNGSQMSKLAFCFALESLYEQAHKSNESGSLSLSLIADLRIDPYTILRDQAKMQMLIGVMTKALTRHDLDAPKLASQNFLYAVTAPLLPIPFETTEIESATAWNVWTQGTIAHKVRTMGEVEWRSCYSNDPYMLSFSSIAIVHLQVEELEESFRVQGRGSDVDGNFQIVGCVRKSDWTTETRHEYEDGHVQQIRGAMTPFGLIGFWQFPSVEQDPAGMFMTWKM